MKLFRVVLVLCLFIQEGFLDEYMPKYLQSKYNVNQGNNVQPSGTKTFTKTKTKTGLPPGTYTGGCTGQPQPPHNSKMQCSKYSGCKITCMPNYKFPDGSANIIVMCEAGKWNPLTESGYLMDCEPICLPECQNNGICVAPSECNCPENFSGPQCQFENKPCLNFPPMPMNSKRSCRGLMCTIICMPGHQFPDSTGMTTMECKNGNWAPTKIGWSSVPDCQATCNPPCQNGGNCLSFNVCQCPQDFRGPQCQYSASACSPKNLQFNGAYNCSGDGETLKCSVNCPSGIQHEFQPQLYYACRYDTGRFLPEPIPQCVYPENQQVIPLGSTSHTYYKVSNYSVNSNSNSMHGNGHGYGYDNSGDNIVFETERETQWLQKPQSSNYVNNTNVEMVPIGSFGRNEDQYVVVEEKLAKPGTCFTWAGNHYKTFDGAIYTVHSNCAHVLARDSTDNSFTVIVQNNPCQNDYSKCYKIVKIYLQDKEYVLRKSENGVAILVSTKKIHAIPGQLPGMRTEMIAHFVVVHLDICGVKIKWDGQQMVQVMVNEAMWNRTEGMCGRMDGNSRNDLMTKQGKFAKNPVTLASSWKVDALDSECGDQPTEQHTCANAPSKIKMAEEFCSKVLLDKRFMACQKVVDVNLLMDTCKADYCTCTKQNPNECACDALNIYIRTCAHEGVHNLVSWRDEKVCPMTCTGGRIYMPCAPVGGQGICGASVESDGDTTCEEGCYCPPGTYLHNNECITKDKCPCKLRGKDFPSGTSVPKECNTCTCNQGQWLCTQVACGARCSALGDPHYITFDGKRYDFMGQCSYYLVKTDNMSIEAENVACSGAISAEMNFPLNFLTGLPSCTKAVTVRYQGLNIKLKQNHDLVINGKDITKLPYVSGGIKIKSVSSIFLVVNIDNGVEIWWDGLSRVYVDVPAGFKGKTKGLCGTFNDNQKDDFLTPENDVETATIPFANKWKTEEKCNDIKEDIKNHPCTINVHNKASAEKHCKVLKSKLFAPCHWYVNPDPFYQDCLYDLCSCEAKLRNCFCPMVAAYAQECAVQGVNIPWRQDVPECGVVCPPGQTYQMCGNTCARSCNDLAMEPDCKPQCAEGCNCPEGEALDDQGECIPIGQCKCYRDGVYFPAGFKEVRVNHGRNELCTCVNANWQCQRAKAQDLDQFPPLAHLQSKCNATRNMVFTTCESPEPVTCKNMHDPDYTSAGVCHSGCECKKGHVLDTRSKMCVKPEDCPCHHGGRSYKERSVVQNECNTCKCKNGKWDCTTRQCSAQCSAWGDSHFKTFDGTHYDYQGQCDYVLTKGATSPEDKFDVTIQNVPCGTLGVACSKSVTLKIGSGPQQESITLQRGKHVRDNQIFKRFTVRNKDLFVIVEAADLGLTIHWDKGTRVYVKVDPRWKNNLRGLCGNYNDNQADDFMTPSGGISEVSPILFGDSWKLQSYCPETKEIVDTCEMRPDRKQWALKECGILKGPKFASCHSIVPVEHYIDRCVFDSCACDQGGDCECLCTAIAAYAQECSNQGHPVKWRSQELCPIQCDERCASYSSCVSTCPVETCENLLVQSPLSKLCKEDACVEGCQPKPCPADHVYANASLLSCVPSNLCKPVCMEIDDTIYYEGDLMEEDQCHSCYCSRGKKTCKGFTCPLSMTTTLEPPSHEQNTQCRPGWSDWINQDKATDNKSEHKYLESEDLPQEILLNNLNGSARCDKDEMIDIECRTTKTHLTPKETGMDVECSLERGLICKSKKGQRPCPDFEIRVLCKCETVIPCDPRLPNQEFPGDCHRYQQCAPAKNGYGLVEKTCGQDMMYNPSSMICDWPANVKLVKPECEEKKTQSVVDVQPDVPMEVSICNHNERYDECAIQCDKLCLFYSHIVKQNGLCQGNTICEPGCVSSDRPSTCAKGMLWANNNTCISIHDCMCASHDGKPVKPGTVNKESECMICQCVDNFYACDKTACGDEDQQAYMEGELYENVTRQVDVVSLPVVISSVSPPKECLPENFIDLIQGKDPIPDSSFTASSYLSGSFAPYHARIDSQVNSDSGGSWTPMEAGKDQYLQVDLGKLEPVYGVVMKGSPLYTEYVTSFKLMYATSTQNPIWNYVLDRSKEPHVFRGCLDGNTPIKHIFYEAIEARLVKFLPLSWHGNIAMRVELIGCGLGKTTLPSDFITVATPRADMCLDPMGILDGTMSDQQITISSEYGPHNTKKALKLNSEHGWRPITNSPSEYIEFNFLEPRNITGFVSKGGPSGWVTAFQIKYSHNGNTWNPIMDELHQEKTFLGNFDEGSAQMTNFMMPILTTYLMVIPLKWYKNIELRLEINGCYLPYPTVAPQMVTTPSPCNECTGVAGGQLEIGACRCEANTWWDGVKCVTRPECPCIFGNIVYPIGTVFEKEDCTQCICKLGGNPYCIPKKCPPCSPGLKSTVTSTCGCVCLPCEVGTTLCPTSNICINTTSWCDGIQDCPDDEINCQTTMETTTDFEVLLGTTISYINEVLPGSICPPILECPPGYKSVERKASKLQRLSYVSTMFSTVSKKTPKKSALTKGVKDGTKGGIKGGYNSQLQRPSEIENSHTNGNKNHEPNVQCPEYKCVSVKPPPPFKPNKPCPPAQCPPGFNPEFNDAEDIKNKCPFYECSPSPLPDVVCNVTGKSFNTFDDTEYKYDICNHVLARDLINLEWAVILQKNCTTFCTRNLVIHHNEHTFILNHDMSVDYNGFKYSVAQTKKIGSNSQFFSISRLGNTLLFVSEQYGFWVIWNRQGNLKLGVSSKLARKVDGLCGFYNGKPEDDKRKPDGTEARTTEEFGDSWLQSEGKLQCDVGGCPPDIQNNAWDMCNQVKSQVLSPCSNAMDVDAFISRCLETTCSCLQLAAQNSTAEDSCRCKAMENFVIECMMNDNDIELTDWRTLHDCPVQCEAPLVYQDCYRRRCEPSCEGMSDPNACPKLPNMCFPGCYCSPGLVRKGDSCIKSSTCKDCECNVLPHLQYVTYDDSNFTINGNCVYVMSRDVLEKYHDEHQFQLLITNHPCRDNAEKMCVGKITILHQGHKIHVFFDVVRNKLKLIVDAERIDDFEDVADWMQVRTTKSKHMRLLLFKIQVEISVYFPSLGVSIKAPSHKYAGKLEGLCGDCNKDPDNDWRMPDGNIAHDQEELGPSWLYDKLPGMTKENCENKPREICEIPSVEEDPCMQLLDASRYAQCHPLLDPGMFLDWCHKDTCGGHPELACASISSYARECLSNGFCVHWHSELCPQTKCPEGQQYQTCGTSCPKTCDSLKHQEKQCHEVPTSGCFCADGKVMQNNTCIEERICITCDEYGHHPGDKWTKDACTTCECIGTSISCETKHCPAVDTLCENGYTAVKLTKEADDCCEKYICTAATPSPTCDPPQKLECAYGQIAKLDTKSDGCQQFVCECRPPEDCDPLNTDPEPGQETGMVKKIKDGGCCPTVELVCNTDLCPIAPDCDEFYSFNTTKNGKCCPEYKCVPPEACIVDLDYIEAENGGERLRSQYEKQHVQKTGNDTWINGPCRFCKCYGSKSTGFHSDCEVEECPLVTASPDYGEYDLLVEPVKGQCCPDIKRSGCKYNNKIYYIGEKWVDEHNPCTKLECAETKGYGVQKLTQVISCDETCDIGHVYVPKESKECCGYCKAIGCVVDGNVKSVGANWTSEDFCMHYTCQDENGTMQVQSVNIVCPEIPKEQFDNFVYEFQSIEGECCKKHKMTACKVGDTMYMVGQSWPCPEGNKCTTYTCVETVPGVLKKQESIKTCDTDCLLGWEYVPSNSACCGECVQHACVVENTLKAPGTNWSSPDNCTTFSCDEFLGQFTVTSHQVSCPQIDDCPPEMVYTKGCCKYCNVTALAMGDCVPQEITGQKSTHFLSEEKVGHGICKNVEALKGFTECVGTCQSATLFNKATGKHESICSCCRALKYTPILVELTCPDGYKFMKPMSVPSKCGCEGCTAMKNPLLQGAKGVKH